MAHIHPLHILIASLAGLINRRQAEVIEYLVHFNHERNHQGIGNELVSGGVNSGTGPIECRERLGGLLKFYHRVA
jgi:hypothetical protein